MLYYKKREEINPETGCEIMGRVGFIHDKLDIKFLILYIDGGFDRGMPGKVRITHVRHPMK